MRQQEQPAPWGLIVVRTSLLRTVRANIQRRPLATSARRALNLRRSWRQSRTRPRDGWQRQDCGERLIDYGRLLSPRKQPTDDNPKTECLPKAGPETTFGTGNDRGTFTRDGLVTASLLPEFSPAPPSPLADYPNVMDLSAVAGLQDVTDSCHVRDCLLSPCAGKGDRGQT